jgi:peptidoglycan hydrolase-like protein with peptidoglycan-binding domain
MRGRAAGILGLLLAVAVATLPAAASAAGASATSPATSPAVVPAEHVAMKLGGVGGDPLFAPVGGTIVIYGRITPYQPGQRATIVLRLAGRQVGSKVLAVVPRSGGSGSFQVRFQGRSAGSLTAVVGVHVAAGVVVSAHIPTVKYVHTQISPGSSGESVRVLQSELNRMHYAVPLSGVFDEGTEEALIAFRKITGMDREGVAGAELFRKLAHGEGAFPVRYPHDGRHVEANLTKQVLAEIEPGGKVRKIYTTSSGKPSTPTVVGRFTVYEKTFGVNTEGMVDSNYFIRGYAIHGYAEVPTYPASHGCLRVPIPDASSIYAWVQIGTPVDVYDQGGGGSTTPRSNAGP